MSGTKPGDDIPVQRGSSVHPSMGALQAITDHVLATLGETVDWFFREMPGYYQRVTPFDEQMRHIEMAHAMRRGGSGRLSMLDDAHSGKVLFVGRPGDHTLLDVVATLGGHSFHRVELHTARDHSLFIHAFVYAASPASPAFDMAAHRASIAKVCRAGSSAIDQALVDTYLDAVDQGYLSRSPVERVERHIRAWATLAGGEDLVVAVETFDDQMPVTRMHVATDEVEPRPFLQHLARVLKRWNLSLTRGYLDLLPDARDPRKQVLISTVYVVGPDGGPLDQATSASVRLDLEALRRLFNDDTATLYADGIYTLTELEILRAALGFAGQILVPDHPFLDVQEVGFDLIRSEPVICRALCQLLALRFDPIETCGQDPWRAQRDDLLQRIRACDPLAHAVLLEGMLSFIESVQLTNAFRPARKGLAFRIEPSVLPEARYSRRPYGVLYFSGPAGIGFHVRFRASARGGLRLLLPRSMGQYLRYRDQLLKEVYDLAWAQELKNKDIPEGGSKCIALTEPGGDGDAVVRQVTDSLLDLILPAEAVAEVIGPHRAKRSGDLIFLGPDENMTPPRIIWVAERARLRGLPNHLTLMSSKPGSGINHKEFGVTSEGIFRWISHVLPMVGIPEGRAYRLKITGGPDGDLGGNLLRILHREHGDRCRVVAIADGTGYATDPGGLDWQELLRLVASSSGIAGYRREALRSPAGRATAASDKISEQARNELHNLIEADLFIPCGGRPYTIDDRNWKAFLRPDGRPTALAMVEGANIFISPQARRNLEDAGLMVIKDSSANKGGVICSSYEVLAGLVLSEAEFVREKPRYVAETIDLLRSRADAEARALFAAWTRRQRKERLSDLSQQISEEINRVSALFELLINEHLEDPAHANAWQRHLQLHCPPVLVERYADRLLTRIPRPHRIAILAKRLASLLVYREGLTWCRTYLAPGRLWEVLATWLDAEEKVAKIVEALQWLDVPSKDEFVRIIAAGSARELVRERLGQEF